MTGDAGALDRCEHTFYSGITFSCDSKGEPSVEAVYFGSASEFRDWLAAHHQSESEMLVGFYKVGTGVPSLTWAESVDEALCVGWIDGIRRSVDERRYTIRFTPRRPDSIWSKRNIDRIAVLECEGRMMPPGREVFEQRREDRSGIYSFEQNEDAALPDAFASQLGDNPDAEEFFSSQAAWYRRAAINWVVSAKREATRQRRMDQLIEDSAAGRTVKPLTRKP